MEHRALSWLELGNRFETFRLTTLGKKNPQGVFFCSMAGETRFNGESYFFS